MALQGYVAEHPNAALRAFSISRLASACTRCWSFLDRRAFVNGGFEEGGDAQRYKQVCTRLSRLPPYSSRPRCCSLRVSPANFFRFFFVLYLLVCVSLLLLMKVYRYVLRHAVFLALLVSWFSRSSVKPVWAWVLA